MICLSVVCVHVSFITTLPGVATSGKRAADICIVPNAIAHERVTFRHILGPKVTVSGLADASCICHAEKMESQSRGNASAYDAMGPVRAGACERRVPA